MSRLATRFSYNSRVSILSFRSLALWITMPEGALADANYALKDAREIGHATTLMYALGYATLLTHIYCGDYAAASAQADEVVALADEKSALFWKALGMVNQGWLLSLNGKPSKAVPLITAGIAAYRSTGSTVWSLLYLSYLATAHAALRPIR